MDSRARLATSSSESSAITERISARSAGGIWTPPVHTASLCSRLARPCRKSSSTSALSVSTGGLPQIVLGQHNCTGGVGSSERRNRPPVQVQQQRGTVRRGDLQPVGAGEMPVFTGLNLAVEHDVTVRKNLHVGSRIGRDLKI